MIIRPGSSDRDVYDDVYVKQFHVPPVAISPRTILDLGCNVGYTLHHYSTLWPSAKIVGVDLDEENCRLARLNGGCEVIHAAVAKSGGLRTYRGWEDSCCYRLMDDGDRPVEAIAFTELLAMVGGADLVKMDIEGAEWEVLASDGWEKLVETILVEVHGEPYEKMIDLLAARGFSASKHTAHWSSVWAVNSRG